MGSLSIWHWAIVVVVALLLFGRGKISELMGDVAQGIKAFKKGMAEDDVAATPAAPAADPMRSIDQTAAAAKTEMKNRADTERKFEGGTV
jgi:sec-independent protein translocase protein TatA